ASEVGFPLEQILQAPDFYLASPDTLVDGVREADDRNQTLMLFGHNPGFTFLANSLGDLTIDNMPTCSIATFEFDIERWRDLDYGCGKLAFFDYPKNTDKA
ncbi:MAG: histidine phosphatase family protein, partial [Gammaproteobacteria bacterium]|nr:histidine phosphatase family protein [Gammaproteobacteria bacterium]